MTTLTNFNVIPYNDDYDENDKFHRVLFRPSYAVQARELTQLQTILQNQIDRFGKHMFEQGSMVIPGDLNFDLEYYYIKVNAIYNSLTVEDYRTSFVNTIIKGNTTGIKARVIGSLPATSTDPITLYVKYENSGDSGVVQTFSANETFTCYNVDNTTVTNTQLTANQTIEYTAQILEDTASVGTGSAIQIHEGVYFINGFFVKNNQQTLILEKYSPTPTYRIGFEISENFISPEEDASLLDNAQGSSNVNAPGSHRFKIDVTLTKKSLTTTDDTAFIELARINNGIVERFVKYADYSIIEHTLARRTHDESGSYEVTPFIIETREHLDTGDNRGVFLSTSNGDTNKLVHSVAPGKAYVEGYELETMTSQLVHAEKPRTFVREVDSPIQTPVGNYVLVNNLTGVPKLNEYETINLYTRYIEDITTADRFDSNSSGSAELTDIPLEVDPSNQKQLLIGTAKARVLMLHDGDYTATAANVRYKLSLFDVNVNLGFSFQRDVKSFRNQGNTLHFQADIVKSFIPVSGLVTTASNANTVTGIGTTFANEIDPGDYLYTMDGTTKVGIVSEITNLSTEANPTQLTLEANAATALTEQSVQIAFSELINPNQNILVFDTGQYRMRKIRGDSTALPDNVRSTAYTIMRYFEPTGVTNQGTVSFSVSDNESFESIASLSNYFLTVVSPGSSSGTSNGDIIPLTTANLAFAAADQQQINITGLTAFAGDSVRLVAAIRLKNAAATEKVKSLTENHIDEFVKRERIENSIITLGRADGFKLKSVKMSPGTFAGGSYLADREIDITSRYTFDTGQRDSFYDLASIRLIPGQPVPVGPLRITYDFFNHGAGDYFSVDSYSGVISYEDIPVYTSSNSNGNVYDLRDCLDFRPRIGDSSSFAISESTRSFTEIPKIGTNVEADYSYYLGRIDILYLDRLGKFDLVKGVPALNPTRPQSPDSGMVLYEIEYKPYVISTAEVTSRKLDNRRYTMRDIGKLEKRITNLEYYTSLNLLEKETAALVIKDEATGLDRLKNGFIVDNFSGHIIGDVKNPDYMIAVNMKDREARPMGFTDNVSMIETLSLDSQRKTANYKKHRDGIITLDYEEVAYIENPYATDSFDVNPYKVAPFSGEITLIPYSDDWKDVTRRPDIIVNDDNNFDVIRELAEAAGVTGTIWNEWQDNWFGARVPSRVETLRSWNSSSSSSTTSSAVVGRNVVSSNRSGNRISTTINTTTENTTRTTTQNFRNTETRQVFTQNVGQVRSGIRTTLQSTAESNNLGDRIVNMSLIPYMRSRPISITCLNMKPSTKIYAFFDDQNVSDFVTPADVFSLTTNTSPALGRTNFDFVDIQDPGSASSTDSSREFDGEQVQAFSFGDVISNTTHSATGVSGISVSGSSVTVTVASINEIRVGHHVEFTGINTGSVNRYDANGTLISSLSTLNKGNSRGNTYRVSSITGNTFTILNTDDTALTNVAGDYVSGGTCQRLQATGHVAAQGIDNLATSNQMPVDIYVTNIKNGFAIDDRCTGRIPRIDNTINEIKIGGINGVTVNTTLPTIKSLTSDLVTDARGNFVGVYYLPNTETVRFRTGERVLRLIDNINNNPEIGLHTSKAEIIYSATGIAEEREQTILNIRKAQFVRDRVNDDRVVSRDVRGASQISRSLVSTNTNVSVSNQVTQTTRTQWIPPRRHDPLGQTFLSQGDGGVYVTKVDLYFQTRGQRPVLVQLVNTIDGHPSLKVMSQKILQPEQLNISDDASAVTTFAFDSPIYLKDDIEYAILIKTDEPGCRVFFSEVGETNLTNNRIVSSNPLTGTLYLSQNGSAWTPHQYRDLKFTLHRASFNVATEGIVEFVNSAVPKQKLQRDPFEINGSEIFTALGDASTTAFTLPLSPANSNELFVTVGTSSNNEVTEGLVNNVGYTLSGSTITFGTSSVPPLNSPIAVRYGTNKIRVTQRNHGFVAGDLVTISGVPDGFYGVSDTLNIGFDADDFNTSHTVASPVTVDSYIINLTTSFTNLGRLTHNFVGGNSVVITRNMGADILQPSITQIQLPKTNIEYRFSGIDKLYDRKISVIMQENENYYADSRYIIASEQNQNTQFNGGRTTNIITGTSAKLTATLASENDYISPIIDGQRVSLTCTTNRISNYAETSIDVNEIINVTELDNRVVILPRDFDAAPDAGPGAGISFDADIKEIRPIDDTTTVQTPIKNAFLTLDIGKQIIVTGTTSSSHDGTYTIMDRDNNTGAIYVKEVFTTNSNLTMTSGIGGTGSGNCGVTIFQKEKYLSGIAPTGTSNIANYITKRFTLANPATSLKVLYEANRPSIAVIDVYYKIMLEGDNRPFDDIPYQLIQRDEILSAEENPGIFKEREHTVSNLPAFVTAAIKIEMKSTSTVKVPRLTNLRILALAI